MRVHVRKWGNSLALRIPRSLALVSQIKQGSLVEVSVSKGKLMVAPVAEPTYTLKELLAGVKKRNIHREVDTGAAAGNEAW